MSVVREGGCSCGAVRYRLTSDPLFVQPPASLERLAALKARAAARA